MNNKVKRKDKPLQWKGSKGEEALTMKKVLSRSFAVVFTIILLLILSGVYYVYSAFQPIDSNAEETIEVEIPLGSSVKDISIILENNEVIKDDSIFYLYARFKKESDFQAGTYQLSQSSDIKTIIQQLKEGKVYADTNQVVIPEGLKVSEITDILVKEGLVARDKFVEVVNHGRFDDISIMDYIPQEVPGREYRLEGYLFPKTYEFPKNATEEEIVRIMLKQTENELKQEWLDEIDRIGMTVNEIMSLAAIIERETVSGEERAKVAGVYYNRLEDGMKLQADATVQYALGEHVDRVLYEHLEIDHPSNTYVYHGLPPAPIAAPGSTAIEAAIYPEEHDYYFYVTKKDGSNEHYFAETYEEHLNNIEISKNN